MPPAGGTQLIISEIDAADNMRPPETTVSSDVVLERDEEANLDVNGYIRPKIVETAEVIDTNGCPVNLCAIKEIVADVVTEAVQDVPPEVKEVACTSSLVCVSLAGLFFSIVLYRYLRHLYFPEPEGFFCGTFSWLFAPLFDALCERHPMGGFFHEMSRESSILYGEVRDSFSNFFNLMMDGFHALRVIFSTMCEGLIGNIDEGVEELAGNMSENVSFLVRFCDQVVHGISRIFVNTMYKGGESIWNIFAHNH